MSDRVIRVVFADDEPIARRGIERLLRRERDVDVAAACKNGTEALEAIRTHHPDLALLDVAMPGMSGLDVVRALTPGERPAIVFVTAFDRFALEAFDVHAVDYLVKPFDEERFHMALERARERLEKRPGRDARDQEARMTALLTALEQPRTRPDRLAVRIRDRIVLVPIADIDWCEAADNYVTVVARGKRYLMRETMRALEERLGSRDFARIHRSTIVNLSRIAELRPMFHGEYSVRLHDGTALTLSRTFRDGVLAQIASGA